MDYCALRENKLMPKTKRKLKVGDVVYTFWSKKGCSKTPHHVKVTRIIDGLIDQEVCLSDGTIMKKQFLYASRLDAIAHKIAKDIEIKRHTKITEPLMEVQRICGKQLGILANESDSIHNELIRHYTLDKTKKL
jgi:hypothetical protein